MYKLISIGIGGFIGAISRYYISGITYEKFGTDFPYGTLAVNVIGAFILGFLMSMTESRLLLNPAMKSTVTIGFLGAFTTFSTFSYETAVLLQGGDLYRALANIFISVIAGLVAVLAGIKLGHLL